MENRTIKSLLVVAASGLLLLSGCTTDGGQKSTVQPHPSTTAGGQVMSTDTSLPKVSGQAGTAPTIEAPHGTPPSTLRTQDEIVGSGAEAKPNSTLTVHYTLMAWSTGKVVESSWSSGNPATFPLAQVIPGWQQGIPGMKVGGRRLLVIPPALGYGAQGSGPIGPNETLIFVVDLISVA
jgi:peptidylprolyl isomerase